MTPTGSTSWIFSRGEENHPHPKRRPRLVSTHSPCNIFSPTGLHASSHRFFDTWIVDAPMAHAQPLSGLFPHIALALLTTPGSTQCPQTWPRQTCSALLDRRHCNTGLSRHRLLHFEAAATKIIPIISEPLTTNRRWWKRQSPNRWWWKFQTTRGEEKTTQRRKTTLVNNWFPNPSKKSREKK